MKKAIEKLERVKKFLLLRYDFGLGEGVDNKPLKQQIDVLSEVIAELKAPRWETPEQRKKRTGEAWPEDGPVYWRWAADNRGWVCGLYEDTKSPPLIPLGAALSGRVVVCATEAGPPPDGWRPE